jgi:hypothetical protein
VLGGFAVPRVTGTTMNVDQLQNLALIMVVFSLVIYIVARKNR